MPGFLDKVKQQAGQVAQKAQEAGKAGQAKLDASTGKKRTDALFRDLGAAVYAERSGRATPETASEIERLLAAIREVEAESESGPIDTAPTAPATPPDQAGTAAPEGNFNLDDL